MIQIKTKNKYQVKTNSKQSGPNGNSTKNESFKWELQTERNPRGPANPGVKISYRNSQRSAFKNQPPTHPTTVGLINQIEQNK